MPETTPRKSSPRLFIKVTRDNLPQIKDRYPYIYLEHGRLEVDDSSIKWIDAQGGVVRIPAALLQCLLLGPGTSVTHEAVKVLAAAKCAVMWVGEDSLLYYANGITPTADTRNMLRQIKAAADPVLSLDVARRMFARRFPGVDLRARTLPEMMGMEGVRVRNLYRQKAEQYGLRWEGRRFIPGQFSASDTVNRILTACNAALYGILNSIVHSAGFSPYIGFIHSGSPLPFIYDMADLYKADLCVDLAFRLTSDLNGQYDRSAVSEAFRHRVIELKILERGVDDINEMIGDVP